MLTLQEAPISAAREESFPPPGRVHSLRARVAVHDEEQSVGDLRAAVDSLQEIVSELLLRNQMLRMALDQAEQTAAGSSSATGLQVQHLSNFW
jgi:hypothetical protein